MRRIFRKIAKILDYGFVDLSEMSGYDAAPEENTIYFQDHSFFPTSLHDQRVRGFRIIRDPRDVVISGAHYHAKSKEGWLHVGRPYFDGKSYAEMINGLPDMQDRYRFEMENVAAGTIAGMVDAKGDEALRHFLDQHFLTVRYEDLVEDTELKEFKKICRHLKIPFKAAAPIFLKHSLFSNKNAVSGHGRSGKKQQWKTVFNQQLGREFADRHQRSLEILGYEKDDSWVDTLQP